MVFFIIIDDLSLEFGDDSPLAVKCEDSSITLNDLITKKQIHLLTELFRGSFVFIQNQKDDLIYLDKYLNVPLVEAFFDTTSYDAFHRLVENGCTQFPEYDIEKSLFCKEAAERNHLACLKKAYEMGFFFSPNVLVSAVMNQNLEMIHYFFFNNGYFEEAAEVTLLYHECAKYHNWEMLKILFSYREGRLPYSCAFNAALDNNLEILQLIYDNDGSIKDDGSDIFNGYGDGDDIGNYIRTPEVLTFFCQHYGNELSKRDLDLVGQYAIKNDNIDLFKCLLSYKVSIDHTEIIIKYNNIKLLQYWLETEHLLENDWIYLMRNAIEYKNLAMIELLLSWQYIDDQGHITNHDDKNKICKVNFAIYMELVSVGLVDIFILLFSTEKDKTYILHPNLMQAAIDGNQIEMVKHLVSLKCPWPKTINADINNYFSLLKFIHEQGYPCDKSCHRFYNPNKIPFCPYSIVSNECFDQHSSIENELKGSIENGLISSSEW